MWNRNHNPLFFRLNIKDEYQENERVVDQIPGHVKAIPKRLQSSPATNTRMFTLYSSEAVSNYILHIREFINRQINKREINKKREEKGKWEERGREHTYQVKVGKSGGNIKKGEGVADARQFKTVTTF